MNGFRITKVRRDPEGGWWRARVTLNRQRPEEVHRRFGSWMMDGTEHGHLVEVRHDIAAALQEKVRQQERREWELVVARQRAAEAGGRVACSVPKDEALTASRGPIALPALAERVAARVRSLSHSG